MRARVERAEAAADALDGGAVRVHAAAHEVAQGLLDRPRTLPTRFLYDARGAKLFERITHLEEYYLTRAEFEILERHTVEVARALGADAGIVEFGSGSGRKTWNLLEALDRPAAYLPVDISHEQLEAFAERVRARFPGLAVRPVAADYTRLDALPWPPREVDRTLAFFPGSTIGNFEPDAARAFVERVGAMTGAGALFLVGVDLVKDEEVLERAYNDGEGVTAAFNRNLLRHLNDAVGTDFIPELFEHRAVWNPEASRIEMHLVPRSPTTVHVPGGGPGGSGVRVRLEAGEVIVTEHSYKFSIDSFQTLASRAGYEPLEVWLDGGEQFSVHLLRRRPDEEDIAKA